MMDHAVAIRETRFPAKAGLAYAVLGFGFALEVAWVYTLARLTIRAALYFLGNAQD